MSHIGLPGAIGLSSKPGDAYTPYDLGWNAACKSAAHVCVAGVTLTDLNSRGWIEGYLAYVRECLETERIELRREASSAMDAADRDDPDDEPDCQ